MLRSPLACFLALVTFSACQGSCGQRTVDPTRFIGRDAEAVVEIRDLGVLAKSRADLARALSDAVPTEQLTALEKEVELSLGFSPMTEKGLEEAGLPSSGKVAIEVAGGGSSALWAVPVKDSARFEKTIDRIARARANVDATEKVQIGDKEATALLSSFGPEKVHVAIYAFTNGLALIGAGAQGRALLERALARKPDDPSIVENPEYAALIPDLGDHSEIRLISPSAGASAASAVRTLGRIAGDRLASALASVPELRGVKSVGWALGFEGRSARLRGRARLDAEALADMSAILSEGKASPAGVNAVAFDDAVLFVHLSGDPQVALEKLAPPGSDLRKRLDEGFERAKRDIETDLVKDVLPNLSGQAALAMGLGNLGGHDAREVMTNPASALWTVIALGAKDPAKILEIEKKIDAGLPARGLTAGTRTVGGVEAHVISKTDAAGASLLVLESVEKGGARILSNDAGMTERALARAGQSSPDPHEGKPGAVIELRLGELVKSLRSLDLAPLPIMYRGIAAKALQLLGVFDRIAVHIAPASDGLAFEARVTMAPEKTGK